MTLPPNFANKVMTSTGCKVWIGAVNSLGYGIVQIDGERVLAHRLSYEAERGPIPEGMVLDHLCRVRNCVNPDHLEPVTHAENGRRGRSAASLQVGDVCQNGHTIAEGGLYVRASGKTECRKCRSVPRSPQGRRRQTRQRRAPAVAAAIAEANSRRAS